MLDARVRRHVRPPCATTVCDRSRLVVTLFVSASLDADIRSMAKKRLRRMLAAAWPCVAGSLHRSGRTATSR
jgi:hypothetical protein